METASREKRKERIPTETIEKYAQRKRTKANSANAAKRHGKRKGEFGWLKENAITG